MVAEVGALGSHVVLVGFMGAGKTTVGREVARLTHRPFVDLDEEIEARHGPIRDLIVDEPRFRTLEEQMAAEVLGRPDPAVIALGGGAVASEATRDLLLEGAFVLWLDVGMEECWRRVAGSDRPLAQDESVFRRLYDERRDLYARTGDPVRAEVDDVLLELLQIVVERGALQTLGARIGAAPVTAALVADEDVLRLHPTKLGPTFEVPSGEAAKTLDVAQTLWNQFGFGRDGTIVALGGGSTTDVVGFVAAAYLRGVRWIAVPTTLVGQVDAAIGGKTAVNLPQGKNLVGAFHYPAGVVIDPDVLGTLPEHERRNGMAEVVKTGLLAGRPIWELPEDELIRASAAFKAAVCVSDPYERGRREILNLGHTFGHALEAASDYRVGHGQAVALGLLGALRLSGLATDAVEEILVPQPVAVDRERAWKALLRDKKVRGGRLRVVLLEVPGRPVVGEVAESEVRQALDELIVD